MMARGTFANIRLVNRFLGKPGPKTIHIPSGLNDNLGHDTCSTDLDCVGDVMDVYDAAERYSKESKSMIILAGKDYGSGKHPITQCASSCTVHPKLLVNSQY